MGHQGKSPYAKMPQRLGRHFLQISIRAPPKAETAHTCEQYGYRYTTSYQTQIWASPAHGTRCAILRGLKSLDGSKIFTESKTTRPQPKNPYAEIPKKLVTTFCGCAASRVRRSPAAPLFSGIEKIFNLVSAPGLPRSPNEGKGPIPQQHVSQFSLSSPPFTTLGTPGSPPDDDGGGGWSPD